MNFKAKCKRFFTLSRSAEGFTLVELIVVIAILGILSGIGIPGYAKYIEVANTKVDEQNVALLNNIFTVACVSNNVDPKDVKATFLWNEAGDTVTGVDAEYAAPSMETAAVRGINFGFVLLTGSGVDPETEDTNSGGQNPVERDFKAYLGEGVQFKVYREGDVHIVGGEAMAAAEYEYNGNKVYISLSAIAALQNSTFKEIGSEKLLGKVGSVADIAAMMIDLSKIQNPGTIIEKLIFGENGQNFEAYTNELAATLGMDPESEAFETLCMNSTVLANSLVLTAAKKTQNIDSNFLTEANVISTLKSELNNEETATDAMAKLAMTYGMYSSYVKANNLTDASTEILDQNTLTGMADVLKTIESDDFQKYLVSDQGQADLKAYQSAMEAVNDSASSSPEAAKDILTNGFTDTELVTLLGNLMNGTE